MILHFLTDEKFSDYVVSQFEGDEMKSDFVLIIDEHTNLKYFHRQDKVCIISPASKDFIQLKERLSSYRAVVFHGLFWPWQEELLSEMPSSVRVAWVFWGGEIYGRRDIVNSFLSPKTKRLLSFHNLKRTIRLRGKRNVEYEIPLSCYSRIDYCLTDNPLEYEFACAYTNKRMDYLWYNYYSVEETIGSLMNSSVDGLNILINNSCAIEGNHCDAFNCVRKVPLGEGKVIVPLSYGAPWLRKRLTIIGERKWGKQFLPLTQFIPRDEYNDVLKSCPVIIMNHYRPQAMGNILTALWMGARVYMSNKSMQYRYLKQEGLILFAIEENNKKTFLNAPLNQKEREVNRNVIRSIYSKDVMHQRNVEIVRELDGK